MIEITCPRCTLSWYSDEPRKGRARLCERCAATVRKNKAAPPALGAFFWAVAGTLLSEVVLLSLATWWPPRLGWLVLGCGIVLGGIGLVWLWGELYHWDILTLVSPSLPKFDSEWEVVRWPLLVCFVGGMNLTIYTSYLLARGG